jgi:MFS family permease
MPSDDDPSLAGEDELPLDVRRRGRWLAIASHPFSMIFRVAHLRDLATQALLTLGASEAVVGLHASFGSFSTLLQLPALSLMNRIGKRRLLLGTQVAALVAALPLLAYADLRELDPSVSTPLALISLALVVAALSVGSTAWWPLLHGFVTPHRTSRFFAVLRTGWHLSLIAYFVGSAWWVSANPASFGPLFMGAWLCGALRVALVWFFPERSETKPLRVRESLALLWERVPFRLYMIGVTLDLVVLHSVRPFTLVMLRRQVGLSEAETFSITLAFFVGGLVALYPAGRIADRFGARPVLIGTCLLRAVTIAGLAAATMGADDAVLPLVTGLFFVFSLLNAAFGVAEVKTLFALAPKDSPSAVIVVAVVARNVVAGIAPLVVGGTLQHLGATVAADTLYQGFFVMAAALQAATLLPFIGVRVSPTAD